MSADLKAGAKAPDFALPDQDGNTQSLSALLERGPVALFFYPAASTPVCTAQACHFRDLGAEFEAVGALRVGISRDSVGKQASFAARQSFDYPLLSDADGAVAAAYGVKRGILGVVAPVKRTTFVIGTDGLIKKVIKSEFNASTHADEALECLKALAGSPESQ